MKSENAKEYITHATCTAQEYAERFGGRELVVSRWDVSTAIELAEQDAEMRMREKAIKAYCSECACYETGGLRIRPRQMCDKTTFCPKHDRGMKNFLIDGIWQGPPNGFDVREWLNEVVADSGLDEYLQPTGVIRRFQKIERVRRNGRGRGKTVEAIAAEINRTNNLKRQE